jgi:hypothetical protein
MATPGWYPDPSGRKFYWDGKSWHDAVPAAGTKPASKPWGWIVVATVLVFGGFAALTTHAAKDTGYSAAAIQASVVDTCKDAVKKDLRDPDSAQFDDWKAWVVTASGSTPPIGMTYNPAAGDKYYSGAGMVNAKNGFGGYAGAEPYSCDAIVTKDGNIRARAHSIADLLNPSGG